VLKTTSLLRNRPTINRVVLALAVGVVIAACGGATATPAPKPNNFAMTAQNGSAVSGTGEVVKATGSFTLTIKLTGMTPGSIHVSHVHAGGCSHPGGIVYNLQSVAADSSGAATTTSTVPAEYLVPASGWYVNVHFGPDFTEAEYAPSISCGDLQAA
jgi:Cu/Zn superoxide dismutase